MFILYDFFLAPFLEFSFMKRALVTSFILSIGCTPVGILLVLRRMSLLGDALSHAILPGVAIGFLISGLSLWVMSIGGFIAGLIVAFLSGMISRKTNLKEDATFAAFFIISLGLGVMIVSLKGSNVDLMHVLFGSILGIDDIALCMIAVIASLTLIVFSIIYRALIMECFDPHFLSSIKGRGEIYHACFLIIVVVNLVGAFQTLGTLMALGLLMLPSITASLWKRTIGSMLIISLIISLSASYLGLLASFHLSIPSGPSIILVIGIYYLFSLFFGKQGGILKSVYKHKAHK